MGTSEAAASETIGAANVPYKVFISHKVSEHGEAVKHFKNILTQNNTLKEKLEIYISTQAARGENWDKEMHRALDEADMMIYVYCYHTPPQINDWCSYETGYYSKKSSRTNLITIVPENEKPPSPVQSYSYVELTTPGIKNLLRRLYKKENIYPDVFDSEYQKELNGIVESILALFRPKKKPVALSPRLWLTIKNEHIEKFKNREIEIPLDSTLTGETDAARKFGYMAIENEEITIADLIENVEYKGTLPLFSVVFSDTLQDMLSRKKGPWRLPPVRILNDEPPRMLVPAYLERLPNGDHKFEFIITEPPINIAYQKKDLDVMGLYNLFIVAWHFRWRVIEKYLSQFERLQSADYDSIRNQAGKLISKLNIDMNAVVLDSFNRGLQLPGDVIRHFTDGDRIIMQKIVDIREGKWFELKPKYQQACKDVDLSSLIDCLLQMQDMNKTCLIMSLRLLEKITGERLGGEVDQNV